MNYGSKLLLKGYELLEQLSETDRLSSWIALRQKDKTKCFLKLFRLTASKDDKIRSRLLSSFSLQRNLKIAGFQVASDVISDGDHMALIFPLLDMSNWKPLVTTPDLSVVAQAMRPLALLLDQLHLQGLVHGDVKLSNIVYQTDGTRFDLKLIDAEFLSRSGDDLNDQVIGTPGFIPPEVLREGRLVVQSDNYSLGMSIRTWCEANPQSVDQVSELRQSIIALTDMLCSAEADHRVTTITEALFRSGVCDESDRYRAITQLIRRHMINEVRKSRKNQIRSGRDLFRFLNERCRILGLLSEHCETLYSLFTRSPFRASRALARLMQHSTFELLDDYFVLHSPDTARLQLYRSGNHEARTSASKSKTSSPASYFANLQQNHRSEFAYLSARESFDQTESAERINQLLQLARAAKSFGRSAEAVQFLQSVLDRSELSVEHAAEIQLELAMALLQRGELTQSSTYAERVQEKALAIPILSARLLRIQGWLQSRNGDDDAALASFQKAIEIARRHSLHDEELLSVYASGVLSWKQGDGAAAQVLLEKAIRISTVHRLEQKAIAVYSTAGLVAAEGSRYEQAITYCTRGLELIEQTGAGHQLAPILLPLSIAYVRTSRFGEAKAALASFLPASNWENVAEHLAAFYIMNSFESLQSGDPDSAKSWLDRVPLLLNRLTPKMSSKYYQSLADFHMHKGDFSSLSEVVIRGVTIAHEHGDTATQSELRMLEVISTMIYSAKNDSTAALSEAIRVCLKNGSIYHAATGFLILLVHSPERALDTEFEALRETLRKGDSTVPLFMAINALFKQNDKDGIRVSEWKSCWLALSSGGQRFLSCTIIPIIASHHASRRQPRHAEGFLKEGIRHADALGNVFLRNRFVALGEELMEKPFATGTVSVQMMRAVSDSLASIGNVEKTAERLLSLAMNECGAERGMLLFYTPGSDKFRIIAQVHCDSEVQEEIARYSAQLVSSAVNSRLPVLVDQATIDPRTKEYPSIMRHNIQSVAAIPLSRQGQLLGVIYMDHHSLPSLFNSSDLAIFETLGEFILTALLSSHKYRSLQRTSEFGSETESRRKGTVEFFTVSKSLQSMIREIEKVAHSDLPILIMGESGTGKEVLARQIHLQSPRCNEPIITVNCAALVPTLVESELFGISKGTASGVMARDGKISAADRGTLFLDEIGDMPLELQAKLLRVLESNRFERVGSNRPEYVDFRLVCATNKNLKELVKKGEFRSDLYFRISKYVVELPALRDRCDEIPEIVDFLIQQFPPANRFHLTDRALEQFRKYDWPGNVRELRNLIERFGILYPAAIVDLTQLPVEFKSFGIQSPVSQTSSEKIQKAEIILALSHNRWSVSKTARYLKIPLTTFRRLLDRLEITREFINKSKRG